ncbi:MAG TPA: hypothetical protein VGO56_05685 [Pyrinomonadaceae bacterium]|jgi:hypothetical protein|nr:hypothetical protein [Pyrinomonadaceae bacterium]
MKRFLMALTLAGLVAVTAFAGDVSTSGAPAPVANEPVTATQPGDIPSGKKAESVTNEALSVALSVLSLLVR